MADKYFALRMRAIRVRRGTHLTVKEEDENYLRTCTNRVQLLHER